MEDRVLESLRAELRRVADPGRAPAMQAYMKSSMPFLGVAAAPMRAACRRVFDRFEFPSAARWRRAVLSLWRGARYREERYGAIELAGSRRAHPFQSLETLPMYEEMIVTGACWDYVDAIATHRVRDLLRLFPGPMRREMLGWSRSSDLWKRRAAILCQVGLKEKTDLGLLYRSIEPSLSSREFFLRKAIGWALRQYAWTDPKEVIRYVRAHERELSPLSRREALRNVAPARSPARARRLSSSRGSPGGA